MTVFLSLTIGFLVFQGMCYWRQKRLERTLYLIDTDFQTAVIDEKTYIHDSRIYYAGWLLQNALPALLCSSLALWML